MPNIRLVNPRSVDDRAPLVARALGRHTPLAVLLVGASLSLLSFFYIRREEERGRVREFERRAANTALRVEDYLQRREEALYALRNLFEYSDDVARAEFAGFARDLRSRQVGVHSLEWVPLVPGAERARFEAAVQAEGFSRYEFTEHTRVPNQVRRTGDRAMHAPVLYIEPLAGNEAALGFDLVSDAAAWPRFLKYAEDGTLAASGRLPLLVPPEGGPAWGYIVELPVYRRPASTLAPAERVAQLRGFVLGIFLLNDVIEEMFRRMGGIGLDVIFLDRSAPEPWQFLHYHPAVPETPGTPPPTPVEFATGTHTVVSSNRAGRLWELWFRPAHSWLASQNSYRSWLFGSLFLGLSIGLSLYLRGLQRRSVLVERLVHERTAELSESQRALDGILHALPGMAYRCTYDEHFDITFASEGSVALLGCDPEEFVSRRAHLRDFIHADDLPRLRSMTRVSVEQQRDLEIEYRVRLRNGTEKWVLSRGHPILAPGQPAQFEGLIIDITAQKRAELERLAIERKLLEGQKLESLGLLAGGIAHDFNNLLTGVLGNAGIARLSTPEGSPVEPQLRGIEHAALRAAELCRQMLAYAGKGRFVVESIDLTLLTEALVPLLNTSIARRANLHLAVARDLPLVMADATQLRQIVMNLVLNAADAVGASSGTITIATGTMQADREGLATCVAGSELAPGEYVFLEVSDTGCGMAPEVCARIFDPFFTTKFAGRGLGLAATLGIVRGHHGALRVRSAVGHGSSFRLLLPPTLERGTLPTAVTPLTPGWHRVGHALVIDDEETVRAVAADMLKSIGLTPRVANDGQAGVAVFRLDPQLYDLVLLDLMMPVMDGEETLGVLRAIRPDVRVLLMSGYSEGDLLGRLGGEGRSLAFLPKPFTRDQLIEKLRTLLE